MLRGNALAKIDEKGRLKLPACYRAIIEPQYGNEFFVTSVRGECVRIYPMEVWTRLEERLSRLSSFEPSVMKFQNAVNYYGQTAVMDSQGRILIHSLIREKAIGNGEVAVLGQQDHLEVWNRAAFEELLKAAPVLDSDLENLARLGL